MYVYLASYHNHCSFTNLTSAILMEVDDDYDGNPYGDKVPFKVGSNQIIITPSDARWDLCKQLPFCPTPRIK